MWGINIRDQTAYPVSVVSVETQQSRHYVDVKLSTILWTDRVSRFEKSLLNATTVFFCKISASVR